MKLVLFGDGQMGRAVAARARAAGHEIAAIFTELDPLDAVASRIRGADAAIDFSAAEGVLDHAKLSAQAGVALVEGTTGWQAQQHDVRAVIEQSRGAMVFGANFSVGVNLFYRLVSRAGEMFRGLDAYGAYIEEAHHARKRHCFWIVCRNSDSCEH